LRAPPTSFHPQVKSSASSHFDLLADVVALPFAVLPSIRQGILEHATEEDEPGMFP